MPSILFVCTANRFRSPLAAGIFEKALEEEEKEKRSPWRIGKAEDWQVASAGIWAETGQPVLPDVLEAAKQLGIDLTSHRSEPVCEPLLARFDLILVMEESQREVLYQEFPHLQEHIYLLSQVINHDAYDFPDTHDSPQGVMQVGVVINDLIRRNLHYICVLAIALHNRRATS